MYFLNKRSYDCSGCTACLNICKHDAITMEKDGEGFLYPIRNKDKCIECGLCEKICPFEYPIYKNEHPIVYAAYDKKERGGSASGGIFYTIANFIIRQGGIVYGAAYDDNLQVKHVCAKTVKELECLRGSKYVQSDLNNCFKEIKVELEKGTLVFFTGVGCQVAGLYAFLKKDYPNLLTSDIVCHGVPNQALFDLHLKYISDKYHSKVKAYSFRDKRYWLIREKAVLNNNHSVIEYDGNRSPYLYAFGLGYSYRYSCYNCKFAKIPRQGDLSLADFWGVGTLFPTMYTQKGVSLVLLNNDKGKKIWDAIKAKLIYEESTLEDCVKYNRNVVKPTEEPDFRKDFYKILANIGYEKMAKTVLVCPKYMCNNKIGRIMLLRTLYIYQPYMYLKHCLKVFLKNRYA